MHETNNVNLYINAIIFPGIKTYFSIGRPVPLRVIYVYKVTQYPIFMNGTALTKFIINGILLLVIIGKSRKYWESIFGLCIIW